MSNRKELVVVRRKVLAIVALFALIAIPSVAQAGGWAVASFDSMPADFEAGESYDLTYTILQHGQTPVDVGASMVRVTDSRGEATEFQASKTAEVGRYTVTVTFPEAGSFTWEVTQGGFEPHQLGTIEVNAATASAAASGSILRWLLPAALALVLVLIAVQVISMVRNRKVPAPVRAD
jgi:hypothetical protein